MDKQIRIGVTGYGNLGRGILKALKQNKDMQLVALFTRRPPESLDIDDPSVNVLSLNEVDKYQDKIDVMILCGGSARDLPEQGPFLAQMFNTIDSFDTHAKIPDYFAAVDKVAQANKKTSIISVGWDPGLFSLMRMISSAILPEGNTYTFWGKGVSQGHSDAIRRVDGVLGGVQYTIPAEDAIARVRAGENPTLSTGEKHKRECFVVPKEGADLAKIENDIKTMPNYFADYETTVHFISAAELKANHASMPHGGLVIHSGKTGSGNQQTMEFSLQLSSNPEFTSSVLVAYARAAYRLNKEGQFGAKTVLDIAPSYLSPKSSSQLRKELL